LFIFNGHQSTWLSAFSFKLLFVTVAEGKKGYWCNGEYSRMSFLQLTKTFLNPKTNNKLVSSQTMTTVLIAPYREYYHSSKYPFFHTFKKKTQVINLLLLS